MTKPGLDALLAELARARARLGPRVLDRPPEAPEALAGELAAVEAVVARPGALEPRTFRRPADHAERLNRGRPS